MMSVLLSEKMVASKKNRTPKKKNYNKQNKGE